MLEYYSDIKNVAVGLYLLTQKDIYNMLMNYKTGCKIGYIESFHFKKC